MGNYDDWKSRGDEGPYRALALTEEPTACDWSGCPHPIVQSVGYTDMHGHCHILYVCRKHAETDP